MKYLTLQENSTMVTGISVEAGAVVYGEVILFVFWIYGEYEIG
jgi:hypothetical protein